MKDAKGHGSEGRGGASADTRRAFVNKFGVTGGTMESRSADKQAAATLAQGSAKSAPVDVHPAMADSARGELAGATKSDMNPFTARMVLQATNSGDKDYHTLSSSQTSDLHDYAKQFGYRKSASSPGSTSRAFHGYLHKQLTNTRGR